MTTDEINKSKKSKNFIGSAITSLFARLTGNSLTGAERQANEYSSAEADKARAWNERMYLQYESPQGQVNQLKAAGLNPALMYGSAPSGSVDSVSSPESVSPGSGLDLFSAIANMASLKANIDMIKAETRNITASAVGSETSNRYLAEQIKLGLDEKKWNIDAIAAGIRQVDSQIGLNTILSDYYNSHSELNRSEVSLNDLRKGLIAAQTMQSQKESNLLDFHVAEEQWRKSYREMFGANPDANIWTAVTGWIERFPVELENLFTRFRNLPAPNGFTMPDRR